ncbi:MAG: dephospho-CoA kinase [Marinibacterium sp.]
MTFRLGLTGSIGMGKSTTAALFAKAGCAVWDADAAVRRLYAPGGAAVAPIAAAFPRAIRDGAVSRPALRQYLSDDPSALARLEAIVHPLVVADRAAFAETADADILVFDIPLLFETGADAGMDAVAVASVDADTQKNRVLARPDMTEEHFDVVHARQLSDAEKRARADFVIHTDTPENAARKVDEIISQIRKDRHA